MEQIIIEDRKDLYGDGAKYKNYNLFIEAGAGAGKTETVINLIVDQLFSGVSPERIIAITFTNKATEELISRISSQISEKLKNGVLTDEQKSILKSALENIYKMNVSTIHHFCNVILNANCYKAKLSFNTNLLEEPDEEERRNKYYNKWIHSLSKTDIEKIADSSPDAFKRLRNTYNELCGQFDDINVCEDVEFDFDLFFKSVFELIEALNGYQGSADLGSYAEKFINAFSDAYSKYGTMPSEDLFDLTVKNGALPTIRKDIKLKGGGKNKLSKDAVSVINEDEIRPLAEECAAQKELAQAYNELKDYKVTNEYAVKAWNAYKNARDRENLSNNQLIFETYKLINENPDIKEKLAGEYDVIFVDEFQDTDKYQNHFILDLARAIDKRKAKNGIVSTSLVLVGDPKQSIYAFRGADFKLFMNTKQNFPSCGLRNAINVFLPDNYRSNDYVLKWINDTYSSKIFYPGYAYVNMILPRENVIPAVSGTKILAGVYSYNFNKDSNKFNNLARFIKKLKDDNYEIFVKSGKDNKLIPRPIKYSDILVLTTSHTEINSFILAFNKVNIKTLVAGEFDLCSSPACDYIYRILNYLLDRENNYRRLFESDFNSEIYDETRLNAIAEATKDFSAYGKLVYVFNNINLILEEFNESDKELLKTILEQVCENVCYDKAASSVEILDAVEDLISVMAKAELSLVPDEDSVRIMNVHKAKGLTSEIVIIADSGSFKGESSCKVFDDTIYLNNMDLYPTIKKQYDENKNREKLRLEYVASTRAKQVMIFESGIEKSVQLFNRKDEAYNRTELEKYQVGTMLPDIDTEEQDEVASTKQVIAEGFEKVDDSLRTIKCSDSSPSSLEKHSSIKPSEFNRYNRPANNIFGTLFHRVMELYILNSDTAVEILVNRAMNENEEPVSPEETEKYKKCLIECADSVIELYSNEGIFNTYPIREPEFKFCDYSESLYGNKPTLMTGSIDLLLKNDDEVLIVDYKTDTNRYKDNSEFESVLKEKYREQLETYKKVIGKFTGINTDKIKTKIIWMEEKEEKTIARELLI